MQLAANELKCVQTVHKQISCYFKLSRYWP